MELTEWLKSRNACSEALTWKGDRDLEATWNECERSDWLIWLLERLKLPDNQMRLVACAMARRTPLGDGRTTWALLTDERSRNAVEVAERYANGQATDEDRAAAAAADAARAAAWAAAGAADAAWYAAWAAAAAADAARAAAWAAAGAADAAWDAAWVAAWDAARKAQCAIIREIVDYETVRQLWEERNGTE